MLSRPYLVIEIGPEQGKKICIENNSMKIGRDSSNDIAIPNERISRWHARIFLNEGRWMIEDLESTNHTYLNSIKLEPGEKKMLANKNRIQIASQVVLSFHDPDSTLSDEIKIITEGLFLNTEKGDVYVHNQVLQPKLSRRGFSILRLLYEKSLTACPVTGMEEIAEAGWPGEYDISNTMIDSEIYRLRKRLKKREPDHEFIRSERGRGRWFVQMEEK